jgi:AraC family transcriptional regulator
MRARIIELNSKNLIGIFQEMSLVENKTFEVWKNFRERSMAIENRSTDDFISLQQYPKNYFRNFSPNRKFMKWACVEVDRLEGIPVGMDSLVLEAGLYAAFDYKGGTEAAKAFFQYIFGEWIPNSTYELDDRPHFEVLNANYKNNDPNSREEILIPIK